jgi:hypothetical protein
MKFFFASLLLLVGCSGAPFTLAEQTFAEASAADVSPPDVSSSSPEASAVDAGPLPLAEAAAAKTSGNEAEASVADASPPEVSLPDVQVGPVVKMCCQLPDFTAGGGTCMDTFHDLHCDVLTADWICSTADGWKTCGGCQYNNVCRLKDQTNNPCAGTVVPCL